MIYSMKDIRLCDNAEIELTSKLCIDNNLEIAKELGCTEIVVHNGYIL